MVQGDNVPVSILDPCGSQGIPVKEEGERFLPSPRWLAS